MDDLISRQATYLALVEKGQASKRYKLGETWELNGEEIREVLDALPSAQPEINCSEFPNNSDTISRQAAIDVAKQYWYKPDIAKALEELPSAQPERIRERWIEKPHVHGVTYCSLCDYELHTNDTNFCPNCGADMRGEQGG